MSASRPRTWLTARSEHAGLPIYFRRPAVPVAEFAALRPRYPVLLVVEHRLAQVKPGGLPADGYNDTLAALDAALVQPFGDEQQGLVALVETFAGKRTYYIYLDAAFDSRAFMAAVGTRFPGEDMTWKRRDDPLWKLLHGYARDFHFP